ncbi:MULTISPECIES: hypothetical protein [unclassified Mycobacterium]|uniref:hypothetical protein n=1 Tax=unclassified Mycobacterium TaxID=2642494 RepID=UPI000A4E3C95|nr:MULTISPECIES: hypothetical protein [unclassified Mycobacterium]
MKSRAMTAIALFSGATMLGLAPDFGGSQLLSNITTPIATPTSTAAPAPPATDHPGAPETSQPTRDFNGPGGDTGCIPHINC